MEEQEVCQIMDFKGFHLWVETEALKVALYKLDELFEFDELEDSDLFLTEEVINHEISRFLFFATDLSESDNIFIMKNDIMSLIKGIANEITYKVLSDFTDKGIFKMSWDHEAESFVWIRNN